jgi:hypothetical protein
LEDEEQTHHQAIIKQSCLQLYPILTLRRLSFKTAIFLPTANAALWIVFDANKKLLHRSPIFKRVAFNNFLIS